MPDNVDMKNRIAKLLRAGQMAIVYIRKFPCFLQYA
jgi:hypothetical protein